MMEVIFIAGVIQSFFFALLISTKKRKVYADKILAIWLFIIGIHLLYFVFEFSRWYVQVPFLFGFGAYMPTLHGPFLFLYFKALISKKSNPTWKDVLHFLPFIIANLLIIDLLVQSGEAKLLWIGNLEIVPNRIHFGEILNNLVGPVYILIVLFLIKKHQEQIKNIFSYTENVSLEWIKNITYGLGVIWIVVLLVGFSQLIFDAPWNQYAGVMIYITVVLFVFSIGYFGFKQTALFTDYKAPNSSQDESHIISKRYQKSGLTEDEALGIKDDLHRLMDLEKPYLEGTLSLDQVAILMNVSKHQLSQVINEHLGFSFFDMVNNYRVDEFKKRIDHGDAEKFTLLGIAYDCGFNSKASFNRIFKIQTGMTPSAFISSQ